MPDRLSYDEAMLYARYCLKIAEPELKQGTVETYTTPTSAGDLKKPWGREGGFAVVYKFRTLSGQMKAMRCFRVSMNADTQSRYERMSNYFRQHVADITIDFRYYADGILVKETAQSIQKKVCPIIVMEWIEGSTLLDEVDELCKRFDTQTLAGLTEQWLEILQKMRQARMAHGDLAALNVMVRRNGRLVLIDYDGVYIPEFASLPQVVLGQQGYQHPDMINRPFNEYMDDFSALVIYLSLLALSIQPGLWEKYVKRNPRGQLDGNMLFIGDDYTQPDTSLLFHELLHSPDTLVRRLTQALMEACKQPIAQVRFPTHLIDPDYTARLALRQLEAAIQRNDDEQILQLWNAPLLTYGPAQYYRPEVEEVRKRTTALVALKQALAGRDIDQIAGAAMPELVTHPRLNVTEHAIIRLALALVQAYQSDNDEQIAQIVQDFQNGPHAMALKLSVQQQQRFILAQQRKTALTRFRLACYRGRNAHEIVRSYAPVLDGSISSQERELLEAAHRYIEMYDAIRQFLAKNNGPHNASQLLTIYDEELDNCFNDFSSAERNQIAVVRNFSKLERALLGKAYRLALSTAREIEMQTRTPLTDSRLSIARKYFIRSFDAKNVRIYMQNGYAFARWDWPADDFIQLAVLVWRDDRWPLHPRNDDPGRILHRVTRSFYEQYSQFSFPIGCSAHLYVQVFFAISEVIEQPHETIWFYSRGNEPSSRWPFQSVS
jgi:serine/threonine protein kinase